MDFQADYVCSRAGGWLLYGCVTGSAVLTPDFRIRLVYLTAPTRLAPYWQIPDFHMALTLFYSS